MPWSALSALDPLALPLLVVPDVEPPLVLGMVLLTPPDVELPPVPLDTLPLLPLPDVPGVALGIELVLPDVVPEPLPDPVVLEPGEAAGELAMVRASRLHASKSLCVGSAANAMLQTARTLA